MADPASTPISHPEAPSDPLSPVASSFAHKTSASTPFTHAFIEISTPAVNAVAVELDGAPISSEITRTNTAKGMAGEGMTKDGEGGNVGLGEEEDINEEFLGSGERGAGKEVREKRAALLSTRSKDPGVIVDVPQDPTAEEVQAAKSAEGTITPAVPEVEAR